MYFFVKNNHKKFITLYMYNEIIITCYYHNYLIITPKLCLHNLIFSGFDVKNYAVIKILEGYLYAYILGMSQCFLLCQNSVSLNYGHNLHLVELY